MLLSLSVVGMVGLSLVIHFLYPARLTAGVYPLMLVLGMLCGCGIATFSVGISQVSYWFPQRRQGRALAIFAGFGNVAPGIFTLLLPLALAGLGLAGSYLVWLSFLAVGTVVYAMVGRNSWYFQLLRRGLSPEQASAEARTMGQELMPGREPHGQPAHLRARVAHLGARVDLLQHLRRVHCPDHLAPRLLDFLLLGHPSSRGRLPASTRSSPPSSGWAAGTSPTASAGDHRRSSRWPSCWPGDPDDPFGGPTFRLPPRSSSPSGWGWPTRPSSNWLPR